MIKTAAPQLTPSPTRETKTPDQMVGTDRSHSSVFIGMALDMSWRLAIAVLVPIIGGFKLDEKLKTTPLLTIVGFLLAMGGMALVMWQTLQAANKIPAPKAQTKEKRS
jgi:F0F1-type ATP synthase assembly protein I